MIRNQSNCNFLKGRLGAIFSKNREHRYVLWRIWKHNKNYLMVIGLNPSTASYIKNDNTVYRCINYAKIWGYGGLIMTNIFSYRATDPNNMKKAKYPNGVKNDYWLKRCSFISNMVLCGWGNHGNYQNRNKEILKLMNHKNLYALSINKNGSPKHPLYCSKSIKPIIFRRKL